VQGEKKNGWMLYDLGELIEPLWDAGQGKRDTHKIGTARRAAGGGKAWFSLPDPAHGERVRVKAGEEENTSDHGALATGGVKVVSH
jgi:hypothetical protein